MTAADAVGPARPEPAPRRRPALLPLLALGLVLALAAYLRLARLGAYELWSDELYHYFAARSLAQGAGPLLPSGEAYTRGLDLTRLVALFNAHVQPPELATRLPSALFGILNVLLFALVAWRMAGAWAAVAAALLLAVYPEAVFQSRYTRFYTYQLNFGIVALLAGWQLVRHAGQREPAPRGRWLAAWAWAAVALVALQLGARVQVTTLSAVTGLALAIALAAAADLRARGRAAWRESVPLQLAAAGALAAALVLVAAPHAVRHLVEASQFMPLWFVRASGGEPSARAYYWSLAEAYPAVVSLAPLIFLYVGARDWRLGLYLLAWFAVPFLLHSFLFPWKQPRFILLAVPALLLAAAIAAVGLFRGARAVLTAAAEARGWGGRGRPLVDAALAASALVLVATTPAFNDARKLAEGRMRPNMTNDYRRVGRVLRQVPGADTIPLGVASPLRAMLYAGRADFNIRSNFLERPDEGAGGAARGVRLRDEGVPDYYSGVPVLTTPEAIRRHFGARRTVLVMPEVRSAMQDGGPALRLLTTLEGEGEELCRGRCGEARLYRWTPGATPAQPAPAGAARPPAGAR